jgi:type III secretion protein U
MSESGEKSLPPSAKKLAEARKRGQLAHSKDMPAAVSFVVCLVVVMSTAGDALKKISEAIINTMAMSERTFEQRAYYAIIELGSLMAEFVGAAVAAAVLASVLTHVIVMGGPIVTLEPMSQGLAKFDPVTNLKGIFGVQALSEVIKSILKVCVLGVVLAIIVVGGIRPATLTLQCGLWCQIALAEHLSRSILLVGAFIMVLIGIVDILLQNWMFTRDMRMTFDEQKREHKEQEGSPEIKQEQRRLRKEALTGDPVGAKSANIFMTGEGAFVIGIRYIKGETPVPVLVYRSDKIEAKTFRTDYPKARSYRNVKLHARLMAEGKMGQMVPQSLFEDSARMLYDLSML